MPQRVLLVVALGLVAAVAASAANALMSDPLDGGWFAYAPNTAVTFSPSRDETIYRVAAVWLGAIGIWTLVSLLILRRDTSEE